MSLAQIAVAVLNECLRPFLAKWHPRLVDYESRLPASASPVDYEKKWELAGQLRRELQELRGVIKGYADVLAQAAGIQPLRPAPMASKK